MAAPVMIALLDDLALAGQVGAVGYQGARKFCDICNNPSTTEAPRGELAWA